MEDTRDTFSIRKKLHLLALYVSLQHEKLIGFLLLSKTGSLRRPSLSLGLIAPKVPVPLFKYFLKCCPVEQILRVYAPVKHAQVKQVEPRTSWRM